jgi:hypothetical protein
MNQADSGMRFLNVMPVKAVLKSLLDVPGVLASVPKMWKSPTIQRRIHDGGSPEAKYVFERTKYSPNYFLNLIVRSGMNPLNYADAALTSSLQRHGLPLPLQSGNC